MTHARTCPSCLALVIEVSESNEKIAELESRIGELEQTIENLKRGATAFHRWSEVEVVADVGTEFGVLRDEMGLLTVVVRPPGQPWPHGLVPTEGMNTIQEDFTRYVVMHVPERDGSKNDPGS